MNVSPSMQTAGRISTKVATLCGLLLLCGAMFAPERIWSNLLLNVYFLTTLSLGGGVFLALATVCGAKWHVAFRRIPEALAGILPIVGVAMLVVLGLNLRRFGWHHHGTGDPGTFWFKEYWLTPQSVLIRGVVYLVLWILFTSRMLSLSRQQDHTGDPRHSGRMIRLSAVFLAVFAITFSLAAVDWIMSLEPMWFSTVWGVYHFAGVFQSTLAAIILLGILLSTPRGPLYGVFNTEHLHDLGKLLIGFSCFWMYIWFCQYMLIWYSNIPEETSYFIKRLHGTWGPIQVLSLVLNWGIPFFVLLPRAAKRNATVMTRISVIVLLGHWVDLYGMIFPVMGGPAPQFGVWELAAAGGTAGMAVLLILRRFKSAAPVPEKDTHLAESLHYHAY